MENIDCEIYIKNLIAFFENNPNDLIDLIGSLQKQDFFDKLRDQCLKNYKEGEDIVITKQQIINIVIDLKIPELKDTKDLKEVVNGYVQKTRWGKIILN